MTQQPDPQPLRATSAWVAPIGTDDWTEVHGVHSIAVHTDDRMPPDTAVLLSEREAVVIWDARRAGVLRARALLGDIRGPMLDTAHPFRIGPSGPPHLADERTALAMAGRAQAVADARRMARIAPTLFVPQVTEEQP